MSKQEDNSTDWVNMCTPTDLTDPSTPHNRVLVVGEQKFYVNAERLSMFSEFFAKLFGSNFKEKKEDEIEFKEVDAEVFHSFLKLLSPYRANFITKANYEQLVAYSRRFLTPEVFGLCECFVVTNIKELDVVDLLKMAFEYNWTSLKENLKTMIQTHSYLCPICKEYELYPKCGCRNSKQGFVILEEFSVVVNKARIAELPSEIQIFILQVMLDKASSHR